MLWSWKRKSTSQIAYEIYQNRLLLERPGDAESDWMTAEKIVGHPLRTILYACNRPLVKLEKHIWKPVLMWANRQALLGLLGLIGNAGVIIAVLMYIGSEKQRRDAEVLNAWQTLTNSHGQSGNGGRISALEFLNASPRNKKYAYPGANWRRKASCLWICTWQPESLAAIDLLTEQIDNKVSKTQNTLPNATQPIDTRRMVYLRRVQLPSANLWYANLQGAYLRSANLRSAYLGSANLKDANLTYANLQDTDLFNADLQDANLRYANLQGANLRYADLQGADLFNANLQGANLEYADLQDIRGVTQDQLNRSKLCLTKLPISISFQSNRDCKMLETEPETGVLK